MVSEVDDYAGLVLGVKSFVEVEEEIHKWVIQIFKQTSLCVPFTQSNGLAQGKEVCDSWRPLPR